MFHFHGKIYMDEKVKEKPGKYRKMVERRRGLRRCFVIALPVNEENSLEVYSSREFWFQYYRNIGLEIVGLAADRDGAETLLCQIVRDVYRTYQVVDAGHVKSYFQGKGE